MGSFHLGNVHLGSRPWEYVLGKRPTPTIVTYHSDYDESLEMTITVPLNRFDLRSGKIYKLNLSHNMLMRFKLSCNNFQSILQANCFTFYVSNL